MIERLKNRILDHWRVRHTDIAELREELREIQQHLANVEKALTARLKAIEQRLDRNG